MDGPQHYTEAEALFAKAQKAARELDGASAVLYMQGAQWHATMALIGVTVDQGPPGPWRAPWLQAFAQPEQEEST